MKGGDITLEEDRNMPPPLPNNNDNTDFYQLPTTYANGEEGRVPDKKRDKERGVRGTTDRKIYTQTH